MGPLHKVFDSPQNLAEFFSRELSIKINQAAEKDKVLNIALSGGNTPRNIFSLLAEKYNKSVRWDHVHFFWVDERCVPPDDPESNYGTTKQLLLDKISIKPDNIHMIHGENDPEKEAVRYSQEIRKFFRSETLLPDFDIIILGMGDDGHTASIFPGDERLLSSQRIYDTAIHPVTKQKRVTMTAKVINNANEIFFLVTGIKKSEIVYDIFKNSENSAMFPAAFIKSARGQTIWYLDKEAAKFIE